MSTISGIASTSTRAERAGSRRSPVHPIVLGALLWLALFVAWRAAQPGGILFYQGTALAVVVAAAQAMLDRARRISATPAKDALLTFLLVYGFLFTVPTTVDRSYSVRLVDQLDRAQGGMSQAEIERWFAEQFPVEGVRRRLHEQTVTGTFTQRDGRFVLTRSGHVLAVTFRIMQTLFSCRP